MSIQPTSSLDTKKNTPSSTTPPPSNNTLGFDPNYTYDPNNPDSYPGDYNFNATEVPDEFYDPSGEMSEAGNDVVSRLLLILDGIQKNPENTTDAQYFLLYTAGLIQTGNIYNTLQQPDGSTVSLDQLLSSMTTSSGEPLIACAVDIAFEEKYAQEMAAGNAGWTPLSEDGTGSFYDYMISLFPADSDSVVCQQANAEIELWNPNNPSPDNKWTSYQAEQQKKLDSGETTAQVASEMRSDSSEEWANDVNHSTINDVETQLRVDIVHSADPDGSNPMMSLMVLYSLLSSMDYVALEELGHAVSWYDKQTQALTDLQTEWNAPFTDPEDSYEFVGDVEEFVDEIDHSPAYTYFNPDLATTIDESLGNNDTGLLGMDTGYYYYDPSAKNGQGGYQEANVDYLYQHSADGTVFYDGDTDSGYCDANGNEYTYKDIQTLPDNTTLYKKNGTTITNQNITNTTLKSNIHDPNEVSDYYVSTNGSPQTWGQIAVMDPNTPLRISYNNGHTFFDGGTAGDLQEDLILSSPPSNGTVQPGVTVLDAESGEEALYDTLSGWQVDPSGTSAPSVQGGTVAADLRNSENAVSSLSGETTAKETTVSDHLQMVESAMEAAIKNYIQQINTFIDNDMAQ